MTVRFSIEGVGGLPEIQQGDDLAALIVGAAELDDGDILVVTSKIVSKSEGRTVQAHDREAAITAETVRVVATREYEGGVTRIVENRQGIIGAAAGVDASNAPHGTVLLLPIDPDASARALATGIRALTGAAVGVILSDTLGRPWREGQTDIAIGAAGVHVFDDLRGSADAAGKPLAVTMPCVADELAGAAELVKGKSSGVPVAIVRGLGRYVGELDLPGARSIQRPAERDLFRIGADEAYNEGYRDGFDESQAEGPLRLGMTPAPRTGEDGGVSAHIGYAAMLERFPPSEAVALAALAESHGFRGVMATDHFQPWVPAQGESSFVWSVLAAIGERTTGDLGPGVTTPTFRMHPAVVAQASATLGALYPGRHWLGIGSGEALNEHVVGQYWPEAPERINRMFEAVDVIRRLFAGSIAGRDVRHCRTRTSSSSRRACGRCPRSRPRSSSRHPDP